MVGVFGLAVFDFQWVLLDVRHVVFELVFELVSELVFELVFGVSI